MIGLGLGEAIASWPFMIGPSSAKQRDTDDAPGQGSAIIAPKRTGAAKTNDNGDIGSFASHGERNEIRKEPSIVYPDRAIVVALLYTEIGRLRRGSMANRQPEISPCRVTLRWLAIVLSVVGTQALFARPTSADELSALRASRPVIPGLERLDRAALKAQQRLWASTATTWKDAFNVWMSAEAQLDTARTTAWFGIPFTNSRDLIIDEPLAVAALDLGIGVRRTAGPGAHTEVDGLSASASCAGDLIGDRLIQNYGRAMMERIRSRTSSGAAIEIALHGIAVQIACMSDRQLADVEAAMRGSFEDTALRMSLSGKRALIPAFARLMAPVQVLIFDARKHRGIWSRNWHWFVDYGPLIEEDIARAGWASDKLLLWDRRRGKLVGFPPCALGAVNSSCVDLTVFLRSLRDPRAIGPGDCALAGMVSNQPRLIAGELRYACPMDPCSSSGDTSSSSGMVGRPGRVAASNIFTRDPSGLSWRWPRLSDGDRSAMASLCRAPGDALQGAEDAPQQCDIAKPSNPFDAYNACIISAIDGPASTPSAAGASTNGGGFPGVPAGNKCQFSADGAEAEKPPFDRCPLQSCQDKYDPCPLQSCEGKPEDKPPASDTPPSPETGTTSPVQKDERAELQEKIKFLRSHEGNDRANREADNLQEKLDAMDRRDEIFRLVKEFSRDAGTSTSGSSPTLLDQFKRVHQRSDGKQDCADPGGCSGTCTDIGRQLAAANACSQGLLDAIATAIGRPTKGNIPRRQPLGPVTHPQPDAPTTADTTSDVCLLGDGSPAAPAPACGAELCTDGFLSIGGRDTCQCQARGTSLKPILNRCLFTVRCENGAMPDETCACKPTASSGAGGPDPLPRPLPEWMGLRSSTTLPAVMRATGDVPVGGRPAEVPGRSPH
jgi:hypothetical protein